jgi:hypothetical protein
MEMETLYKVSSLGLTSITQQKHYKNRLKIYKHREIKYHLKILMKNLKHKQFKE